MAPRCKKKMSWKVCDYNVRGERQIMKPSRAPVVYLTAHEISIFCFPNWHAYWRFSLSLVVCFLEDDSVGRLLLLLDGENREPLSPCHKPTTPCPACGITRDFLFIFTFYLYLLQNSPADFIIPSPTDRWAIPQYLLGSVSWRPNTTTHFNWIPYFWFSSSFRLYLLNSFFLFRKKSFFSGKRNFLLGFFNMNCCPDNPIAVACPDPFVKGD